MDSIVLSEYDIKNDSFEDLIGYAGITAGYAAELLNHMDLDCGQKVHNHATKFIVQIALIDLKRTMDILEAEALRREDEAKAAAEGGDRPLPHMMEHALANLEAERSGKEGAA